MSKTYAIVIGILILLVVVVGSLAVMKANSNNSLVYPSGKQTEVQNQTPTETPAITDKKAVIDESITNGTKFENSIPLTITTPLDKTTVTKPSLLVSGKTTPKADVNINDVELVANSTGAFSTTITLDEGENTINVVGTDENGNTSEWQGTVTYEVTQ